MKVSEFKIFPKDFSPREDLRSAEISSRDVGWAALDQDGTDCNPGQNTEEIPNAGGNIDSVVTNILVFSEQ
jgi:hypothetical protein